VDAVISNPVSSGEKSASRERTKADFSPAVQGDSGKK